MKMTDLKQELKKLNRQQLQEQVEAVSRELFAMRLQSRTAHLKDNSRFMKLRKVIARIKTFIRQSELGA